MIARALIVLLLLLITYIANAFANPFPQRDMKSSKVPLHGFSYSFEQAKWYGLDPRKSYLELLDMGFDWVRIPFRWNEMVDENGELAIDELFFAIDEAEKRDVKVVIALGAKTPYYPEIHFPKGVADKVQSGTKIKVDHPVASDILAIDKKLVESLSSHENISYWQIENEPFLPNENGISVDKSLLAAEIELVRQTDLLKRPIMLTDDIGFLDRDYKDLINMLASNDILAVNGYFQTQGTTIVALDIFGQHLGVDWPEWFSWPVQSWLFFSPDYEGIIKAADKKGVKIWLAEMQAEPYIRNLEDAKKSKFTFTAGDIIKAHNYLRSFDFDAIGFWGAHFWQYRGKIGDDSWVKTVEGTI